MVIGGEKLDLKSIKVPIYNLATREDHIAPAKSVLLGSKFFGGPVKFVLAGSGHIAGVVNPPDRHKYQYWTGAEADQRQSRPMAGQGGRASGLLVAGLARLAQGARRQRKCRRACPAAASSSRSRTRPEAT